MSCDAVPVIGHMTTNICHHFSCMHVLSVFAVAGKLCSLGAPWTEQSQRKACCSCYLMLASLAKHWLGAAQACLIRSPDSPLDGARRLHHPLLMQRRNRGGRPSQSSKGPYRQVCHQAGYCAVGGCTQTHSLPHSLCG